ncbi:MAG: VWA domain-containing protein [Planctomycetia bacterium]|nr:VWA domain-containing protein [Planctomycetia bacterium]
MKTRHRIPSIFNLSMVDVLCCALGCVILLWLLNFREAKRRAVAAGETNVLLTEARLDADEQRRQLGLIEAQLLEAQATRDKALLQLASLGKEKLQLTDDLDKARGRYLALSKELATLKADVSAAEDKLLRKTADFATLTRDRDKLTAQLEAQLKMLKEKEALALAAGRSADDLASRLKDNEAQAKKLQGLADQLPKLRDEAADYRAKLAVAESRLLMLDKDLGQQKLLVEQAKQAAENRFAGIALAGRRVVFVVDMSGSMDFVDEKTRDPEKWAAVRETLVKIARSLPALSKYQVILFADKAVFPLGNDDRWLEYDGKNSLERISQALAAVKPKGNTNIHAAMEAAFRFRADGLDTIYFFSDGLPNVGPGLPTDPTKTLRDIDRGELLGQYVRRTLRTTWNKPDPQRVRVNTIGFFYESPDLGAFLWALARENDGSFVGMSKP